MKNPLSTINKAIEALQAKGIKPTRPAVAIETGLSVRKIKRHWANRVTKIEPVEVDKVTLLTKGAPNMVTEVNSRVTPRLTNPSNGVQDSSGLERLNRGTPIAEVLPYEPWLRSFMHFPMHCTQIKKVSF